MRLVSKEAQLKFNSWAIIVVPKKGFEQIEFAALLNELYRIISKI